jgi:hypothetical protein
MKKFIIVGVLFTSLSAFATDSTNITNIGANGLIQNRIGVGATGGSVGGFNFQDRLQIPNAPALSSGSSNTTAGDYKYKQRQYSTILGGKTTIDMELDIIGFLKYYGKIEDEETKKTFNMAACIESEKWRLLRKQQGLDCPK